MLNALIAQISRHAESADDKGVGVAIAIALQRTRGGSFDQLTKTKTLSKLLQVLGSTFTSVHVSFRCQLECLLNAPNNFAAGGRLREWLYKVARLAEYSATLLLGIDIHQACAIMDG